MKFVCLNCETYMNFDRVEKPAEGSLGVFFGCPSCGARFSMVTNPGETHMVSSLGVQLGGRTAQPEPFEMTRGTLKEQAGGDAGEMAAYLNDKIQAGQPATSASARTEEKASGCPFSAMVAQMGLTSGSSTQSSTGLRWTPDAKEKLERLPSFVQPMVRSSVESYARTHRFDTVTLQVMDDAKGGASELPWAPDAEKRLDNIPDFIRPMARREIERLTRERGAPMVTSQIMDEAKDKFMKFM